MSKSYLIAPRFTILTEYHDDGSKTSRVIYSKDAPEQSPQHEATAITIKSSEIKGDTTEHKEAHSPMVEA